MAARDVAEAIRAWAKSNRMISNYPDSQVINEPLIRHVFGHAGVPNAVRILQNRGISYIGVNDTTRTVVVFTQND